MAVKTVLVISLVTQHSTKAMRPVIRLPKSNQTKKPLKSQVIINLVTHLNPVRLVKEPFPLQYYLSN